MHQINKETLQIALKIAIEEQDKIEKDKWGYISDSVLLTNLKDSLNALNNNDLKIKYE